mgnify:CR=1 FL=1
MPDLPTISIVIPLYNKAPHIADALNSVLNQTFQDYEVIVIDDGSIDGGAEIVKKYNDGRIQLIRQDNRGVSAARNRGVEVARADLVAFLDADDEWSSNHLEVIMRLKSKYPEAGAYATAYLKRKGGIFQPASFPRSEMPKKPWEGLISNYFRTSSRGDTLISSSTVAVPKAILAKMNGFTPNAWSGEDGDLWGRIALEFPIAFSWDGMGIYNLDAMNRACKRYDPIVERPFVSSALKVLKAGNVPSEMRADLLEYISIIQLRTAYRNLAAGRPDLASNNLRQCHSQRAKLKRNLLLLCTHLPSDLIMVLCALKKRINPD